MSDYEELVHEMRHIKALLAMSFVKEKETKTEKILFLRDFGFDTAEIAKLVGTTPNTVAVALSQAKSKAQKKAKGKPQRSVADVGSADGEQDGKSRP